jgi:hypothetical protein
MRYILLVLAFWFISQEQAICQRTDSAQCKHINSPDRFWRNRCENMTIDTSGFCYSHNPNKSTVNLSTSRGRGRSINSSNAVMIPQFKKEPGIAGVLSFVLPGAGQIYNEQIGKGITFCIVRVISSVIVYEGMLELAKVKPAREEPYWSGSKVYYEIIPAEGNKERANTILYSGIAISAVSWVWSIIDATYSASNINKQIDMQKLSFRVCPIPQQNVIGLQFSCYF